MSPNSNERDGNTLVPLGQFGSASETEVVIGLLRSSGIPAVHPGRYAPQQILVPFKFVAEANRLIADARNVAPSSIPTAEQFADEPRSILTAILWLLAIGMSVVAMLEVAHFVSAIATRPFR
jgi:hypothetical protein